MGGWYGGSRDLVLSCGGDFRETKVVGDEGGVIRGEVCGEGGRVCGGVIVGDVGGDVGEVGGSW